MSPKPRIKRRATAFLAVSLIAVGSVVAFPATASASECGTPVDLPSVDKQWELQRLRPEAAWPLSKGQGQTVAVIDSGVSDEHPALEGQVLSGKDLVGTDETCDMADHGTLVAGIIAAKPIEGAQFYGVAPEARILPIRVIIDDEKAKGDEEIPGRTADAIRYAIQQDVDVINLSLRTMDTEELHSAVQAAIDADIVVVAAAGNLSQDGLQAGDPVYPAKYDGVLGVGGIDQTGAHAAIANSADFVDLAAPAVFITGPAPRGGGYGVNSVGGTSFAAPFVAGTAALVRAYYKDLTAPQVIERLISTADAPPGGWSRELGYGVVNPYQAVASLDGKTPAAAQPMVTQTIGQPNGPIDPLAGLKTAAALSAVGAVSLTIIILVAISVRRHVRGRGKAAV
ncbi:type VII secretion-associated serine protease mycosin [Phytomonospora sp. NPDC050363]|uniref:type VII secretion-associated serine protease mycosin n=1 Tax=Phytomonospora sp. NPDC050363 TaxID=3155642 RepID=UPI00340A99E4